MNLRTTEVFTFYWIFRNLMSSNGGFEISELTCNLRGPLQIFHDYGVKVGIVKIKFNRLYTVPIFLIFVCCSCFLRDSGMTSS